MQKYWKSILLSSVILLVLVLTLKMGMEKIPGTAAPLGHEGLPIEITMSTPAFDKSFPAGFQNDAVAKEIERRLNIKLNIIPANVVGDVKAKFAAELASGDLPDITWVPSTDLYVEVITAGAAYPMDALLEAHGQDILKESPSRIEYARKFLSKDIDGISDGKMYFLSLRGDMDLDPISVQVAPYLRYDLWKQLDFPQLTTMDDYLPILQKMMKLEPVNANGDKNYGVSAWFGGGDGWVLDYPFSMMEGMAQGIATELNMVNYEVKSRITDPNSTFWKGIQWYNKAYRIGILDPESFTMNWDDYIYKANANRMFLGWTSGQVEGGNAAFTAGGETDKGYYQMPAPTQLNAYMVAQDHSLVGPKVFISKNCKHPEKAMELLNFLISYEGTELILNGVKGVHWDEIQGKPSFKPEMLAGFKEDPDYKIKTGIYKYHSIAGRGNSVIDPRYGSPVNFMYLQEP